MAAVESTRAAGKPQLPLDEKTVGEEYLHAREAHARKISAMLEKSTEEERKRRMRITGTCMIAGTIGVLLGGLIRLQSGTNDPVCVWVSANFERLVLGCIEAEFCK